MEINIVFNTTYIDVSSTKEINPELPENFEETIEKCYTIIKYINKEDLYKKLINSNCRQVIASFTTSKKLIIDFLYNNNKYTIHCPETILIDKNTQKVIKKILHTNPNYTCSLCNNQNTKQNIICMCHNCTILWCLNCTNTLQECPNCTESFSIKINNLIQRYYLNDNVKKEIDKSYCKIMKKYDLFNRNVIINSNSEHHDLT